MSTLLYRTIIWLVIKEILVLLSIQKKLNRNTSMNKHKITITNWSHTCILD